MPKQARRDRTGERIVPGPTPTIGEYFEARCPSCFGWVWAHQLDILPFDDDSPGKPRLQWIADGVELRAVRKFPRCPDSGARGFAYRRSDDVPLRIASETLAVFAQRAMAWLCEMRRRGLAVEGPDRERIVDT